MDKEQRFMDLEEASKKLDGAIAQAANIVDQDGTIQQDIIQPPESVTKAVTVPAFPGFIPHLSPNFVIPEDQQWMGGLNPWRIEEKVKLLEAIAEHGSAKRAAEVLGMSQAAHYSFMRNDPVYEDAWKEATRRFAYNLEAEAYRRAYEGVDEVVIKNGVSSTMRRFSDVLLIFLLKGNLPEKYHDRQVIDHRVTTVKVYDGLDLDQV